MKLFAHRGLWYVREEQNGLTAIDRAFRKGYSVEVDLWKRDDSGDIWLGHDIGEAKTRFEEVLDCWSSYSDVDLALNIKCDGLLPILREMPHLKSGIGFFAFDMSMPEQVQYRRANFPTAIRVSEFETVETIEDQALYWLDAFESDWYLALPRRELAKLLSRSIVVSPELHGRQARNVHKLVKEISTYGLCLDSVESFNATA